MTTLSTTRPPRLSQRILGRALRVLPDATAAHWAARLANRSIRVPVQPAEQAAMAGATRLQWGPGGAGVAWRWGTGPLVVLVHGWGGRAAQMAPLAARLAATGHEAVALDVTGHGESAGTRTAWSRFGGDVEELVALLRRPVHAFVCHSAGGLTTMVAAWQGRLAADRYVCIAAPSYPYPPLRAVKQRLNLSPGALDRYRQYLAGQLGATWDALEDCEHFRGLGDRLQLVYDQNDRFVDASQADRILAVTPGAQLLRTAGHGHMRVLGASEVLDAVSGFVARS